MSDANDVTLPAPDHPPKAIPVLFIEVSRTPAEDGADQLIWDPTTQALPPNWVEVPLDDLALKALGKDEWDPTAEAMSPKSYRGPLDDMALIAIRKAEEEEEDQTTSQTLPDELPEVPLDEIALKDVGVDQLIDVADVVQDESPGVDPPDLATSEEDALNEKEWDPTKEATPPASYDGPLDDPAPKAVGVPYPLVDNPSPDTQTDEAIDLGDSDTSDDLGQEQEGRGVDGPPTPHDEYEMKVTSVNDSGASQTITEALRLESLAEQIIHDAAEAISRSGSAKITVEVSPTPFSGIESTPLATVREAEGEEELGDVYFNAESSGPPDSGEDAVVDELDDTLAFDNKYTYVGTTEALMPSLSERSTLETVSASFPLSTGVAPRWSEPLSKPLFTIDEDVEDIDSVGMGGIDGDVELPSVDESVATDDTDTIDTAYDESLVLGSPDIIPSDEVSSLEASLNTESRDTEGPSLSLLSDDPERNDERESDFSSAASTRSRLDGHVI